MRVKWQGCSTFNYPSHLHTPVGIRGSRCCLPASPLLPYPSVCVCVCVCVCVRVTQSCLTLCDPMDCSPAGSSVHAILQARIQKLVAISLSRGSFWPKDWTQVSCIAGRFYTIQATREACPLCIYLLIFCIIQSPWKARKDSSVSLSSKSSSVA